MDTPDTPLLSGPPSGDTPPDSGPGPSGAPPESGVPPAGTERLYAGRFKTVEELEQAATRHGQQLEGWNQERQRMQARLTELEADRERWNTLLQTQQALWGRGTRPAEPDPPPVTLDQALDAVLQGDVKTAQAWERQLIAKAREGVLTAEELIQQAKPVEYQRALIARHPDINNVHSDFYKETYAVYQQLEADPFVKLKYSDDPSAQATVLLPGGVGQRQVDLRIVDDAALQVKLRRERQEGRREEATRRDTPTVEGNGNRRETPVNEPLIYDEEKRLLMDMLTKRQIPENWPKSAEALYRYKWEKLMSEAQRAERQAAKAAGTWNASVMPRRTR